VLFQTNKPDHYALRAAADQNYATFYRAETAERRDPPYPPFRKLVNLLFDGKDLDRVTAEADAVAEILAARVAAEKLRVELMGPAPQPFSRLKGKHRWHLTLRGSDHRALRGLADLALARHEAAPGAVRVTVDVDPVSLL
jgi:primosomal protein N' (replication factor Y)